MTLDVHVRRHVVDAAFQVPLDGVTAVFGPSGAGKTTVLRTVAGLERTSGHVRLGGETWEEAGAFVRPKDRRVGLLAQSGALFPHLDVDANVAFGLHRLPRRERPGRVGAALAAVGASHLAGRGTTELSGGEAQRVALARALAPRPRLLLLDEPLSALDAPTRARLRTELRRTLVAAGVPTLLVTHDRAEALALADRVVVLVDGRVRQTGSVQDVFERPADAAVAAVVGVETAVRGRVTGRHDGLLDVEVGTTEVHAVDRGQAGDVLVCIRAEDVALEPAHAGRAGSARNRLGSTVTAVTDEGSLLRVDLDAGFHLAAYVTRPSAAELDLRPGRRVQAVVKSPAVHLVQR